MEFFVISVSDRSWSVLKKEINIKTFKKPNKEILKKIRNALSITQIRFRFVSAFQVWFKINKNIWPSTVTIEVTFPVKGINRSS